MLEMATIWSELFYEYSNICSQPRPHEPPNSVTEGIMNGHRHKWIISLPKQESGFHTIMESWGQNNLYADKTDWETVKPSLSFDSKNHTTELYILHHGKMRSVQHQLRH